MVKGPTSTVYGGCVGAPLGGLINVVFERPNEESGGYVALRTGSYGTLNPYVDLNTPLSARVATRIAADYQRNNSWIDKVEGGHWSVQPSVLAHPGPQTELWVQGHYSRRSAVEYSGLPAAPALAGQLDRHVLPGASTGQPRTRDLNNTRLWRDTRDNHHHDRTLSNPCRPCAVRGENYVQVLDGKTYKEKSRITTAFGPGMTIFSPDGKYGYVCDSFNPGTYVIDTQTHKIVHEVAQASAFCPDIAASPDGKQVWFTLKDIGKTQVFNARPPFNVLKTIDTGPITNHVNVVHNKNGTFAYVTIGGLNEIKVYRTDDFKQVATIPVGDLPHGLWPSGDGTRVYVGLEGAAEMAAIDTLTNKVIANIPIGQAPQAVTYVPDAVPAGDDGIANLQPLGLAGETAHIALGHPGAAKGQKAPTSVALYNQGLSQILEASVTGLEPGKPYVLATRSARSSRANRAPRGAIW